jgi:ornithine carbamoyltransferase
MHFSAATPADFEIPARIQVCAAEYARRSGATVQMFHDPKIAANNADILYTDTWVSMGQEAQTEKRLAVFRPYQLNHELMEFASKDAIVMHCLPAHRGQEITEDVADGPQSVIFAQSENRLHIQKAILVKLLKFDN